MILWTFLTVYVIDPIRCALGFHQDTHGFVLDDYRRVCSVCHRDESLYDPDQWEIQR